MADAARASQGHFLGALAQSQMQLECLTAEDWRCPTAGGCEEQWLSCLMAGTRQLQRDCQIQLPRCCPQAQGL